MEDLEILKIIKEAEDTAKANIDNFIQEKEALLNEIKAEYEQKYKSVQQAALMSYEEHMRRIKTVVEKEKAQILNNAQKVADTMTLNITDKELKDLLLRFLNNYLQ